MSAIKNIRISDDFLVLSSNHENVRIEPWCENSLRVRAAIGEIHELPGALLKPKRTDVHVSIDEDTVLIRNGVIEVEISFPEEKSRYGNNWIISFVNANTGKEILREAPHKFITRPSRYFKHVSGNLYKVEACFKSYEDERIFGLGQHQHGLFDQKGCVIDLIQRNTEVNIPFLFSSRGYGFLWNNPAVGRVELGRGRTRWVAEASRQLDYWITTGDTPEEIMRHYNEATGFPPLFPEWAAGFWQCKLRYRSQEELLSVAREYRRRGLPLSVIVADFFHWTVMGDWRFDPTHWPEPAEMIAELDEMGVKLMVSIWPTVNPISENYHEMERRGFLVGTEKGVPAHSVFRDNRPEGPVYMHFYDATNPEARKYLWERVRENYYRHGVRVWWLDACEPEMSPMDPENLRYHLGNGVEVTNIYPFMHVSGFYEGMVKEGANEIISLCRSAWAGSQRYGAAVWSGDIPSTFEALRAQVRAGLNMAMSGIPWWTTDIGGFHGGDPSTPYFRELIVRWFQYGVFCPIFRLHGYRRPYGDLCGGPNEVWSFGEEAYDIIKGLLFLREKMRPYIMEQMRKAHLYGTPFMRPLFFDFHKYDDRFDIDDQFMCGPDVLVAPILREAARSRNVYLPNECLWKDAWTGEMFEGGRWITVDAPLEKIPFYCREDTDINWIQ